MKTQCSESAYEFQALGQRQVACAFDGGRITSDGGGLLLREIEQKFGVIRKFASCFTDHRDPTRIEHPLPQLLGQRVFGLALGYEDLNDHDELRLDAALALLVDKPDPTGADRVRQRDKGKALAGKSTLNRLELTPAEADANSRYKKIVVQPEQVDDFFVDLFLNTQAEVPQRLVLDLDATDDPLHGQQEGRFFHGYYREYCYLPLYIFCGDDLLCARLRTADNDAAAGAKEEVARIVARLRQHWPQVRIVVRGDSGFCREELMSWCEQAGVDYLFGLAKNSRLCAALVGAMAAAEEQYKATGAAARVYADFAYRTLKSWTRERRVVGKAEYLAKGENPRFVVTSLGRAEFAAQGLYEQEYCSRGEMENRIKEQQLMMFADRTSTAELRANQLRLWFSSVAYVVMNLLRRVGLRGTEWARAQCDTIRLKLLKIGGCVRVSVRRVFLSLASGYPYEELFRRVYENIRRWVPLTA